MIQIEGLLLLVQAIVVDLDHASALDRLIQVYLRDLEGHFIGLFLRLFVCVGFAIDCMLDDSVL